MHIGRRCGILAILVSGMLFLLGSGEVFCATTRSLYYGRSLVEVLQELQSNGLNVIFSSAVVHGRILVTVEPSATEPRAILDEILSPLGLEARDGPGHSILIVRAPGGSDTGILRGRVVSAARGAPIGGATVKIMETPDHATTLPDGTFEIRHVAPGTYEVSVEASGFLPWSSRPVHLEPHATRGLAVYMEAQPTYLEEVVVTPSRLSLVQQDQTSRLTISDDDMVLAPTFGGDISRVIESLPGVTAPDNSAAFNVRGSQARDVSIVLDGLELYEPFHLLRFQSPFSLVDSEIVERIDFTGGAFTADHGDRLGGVVEVSTWAPDDPHRAHVGVGTLNSRVSYGGPIAGQPASWLASARAWYPESIRDSVELGETGIDPRFEDAYFSLSRNVSPKTVLSAHALLAHDRLEFNEVGGNETVDASSKSGYFWLRAMKSWAGDVISETVLSAGRIDRDREGFSEPEDDLVIVDDNRTLDFFGLKNDVTWQVSDAHLLRFGLDVRRLDAKYRYTSGPADDVASQTSIRLDPEGTSIGGYISHRARIASGFATEVGVRVDRQTYTQQNQISPRFNAVWRLGERSQMRFGLGQYYQSQRIHELRVEDGETQFRRAELSRQAGLTFQHRFAGDLRFRFDAYYKKLSRLQPRYENLFSPVELYPETEADRVLIAADHARLRGVELLARSAPSKRFNWWVSYAWSRAEDVIDGRSVPRSWDQAHAGRFLIGYRFADRWSVSLSGTAHTGWPTTPVSATATTLPDGTTEITPVQGRRNSARFSRYARLDFKASRSFTAPGGRIRLLLEVLNLTNRENTCCVNDFFFTPRPDGSVDTEPDLSTWLGLTPSFSLVWDF